MQSVAWDSISSLNEDGNTESIENDFTFNTQYGFEKVLGTLLGPGPRPRLDNNRYFVLDDFNGKV